MIGAFWRNHRAAVLLGMVGLVALWSMLAFAALLVVGVSHCSQCDMTPYLMRRLGLSFPVAVLFGFMMGFAAAGLRPLLRPYLGARGAILLLLLLTLGLAWLAVPVGLRAVGFVQHRLEGADRERDTGLGGTPSPPADLNR